MSNYSFTTFKKYCNLKCSTQLSQMSSFGIVVSLVAEPTEWHENRTI